MSSFIKKLVFAVALFPIISVASSVSAWACACGCGVFDVSTSALLPIHEGALTYLEYDFMNQNQNWSGTSNAPAENNEDKELRSQYFTAGVQYMFNRRWGAMLDVPMAQRHIEEAGEEDVIETVNTSALGDIRLRAIYTGFSPDMSSGLTFGLKLPSGEYKHDHLDRDTQIGSGSTNVLIGAFRRGMIQSSESWGWFTNVQLDIPVLITPAYHPGTEGSLVVGGYYSQWSINRIKVAPVVQAVGTIRGKDTGTDADVDNSGYDRVLLTPGLEFSTGRWRLYGDVGFPVYQWVRGNQVVASEYYKVNISRSF